MGIGNPDGLLLPGDINTDIGPLNGHGCFVTMIFMRDRKSDVIMKCLCLCIQTAKSFTQQDYYLILYMQSGSLLIPDQRQTDTGGRCHHCHRIFFFQSLQTILENGKEIALM